MQRLHQDIQVTKTFCSLPKLEPKELYNSYDTINRLQPDLTLKIM